MSNNSMLLKRKLNSSNQEPISKKYKRQLQFSYIPDNINKDIEYVAGIDEAGRGPVLGPMVYSIAFYPLIDNEKKLRKIGFNDSKQLSENKRSFLLDKMYENDVGFIVDPMSAKDLSCDMLRIGRRNLNKISHDLAINLIERVLQQGLKIHSLYVDTVGKPEKYQELLNKEFPSIINITVSKKADSIYPIVGAASIAAKVIRDRILESWEYEENIHSYSRKFGSGYPGDQITKDWLLNVREHVFGFPTLVRYSWSTTTNLLQDTAPVYWNFEDLQAFEELQLHPKMKEDKRKSLQQASNRIEDHRKLLLQLRNRYKFFTKNGMSRITTL